MHTLESFLNLRHYNYSMETLQGLSRNANEKNSDEAQSSVRNESNVLFIHKPYSFEKEKKFLEMSRNVLYPSLCLFKNAFGWNIHITTESEMSLFS